MKNKDKDNFNFIKSKFDNDNISTPTALDETGAKNLIADHNPQRIKIHKRKSFKTAVSLVACAAIVITSLTALSSPYIVSSKRLVAPENSDINVLPTFASYSDIEKTVKDIDKKWSSFSLYTDKGLLGVDEAASDISAYGISEGGLGGDDYAVTYKQVDAVDEADIIKNNGKNIFAVDRTNNVINIYDGTTLVAKIDEYENQDAYIDRDCGDYISICDIFLTGDRLVVNVNDEEYDYSKQDIYYSRTFTTSCIYDISDLSDIKKVKSFTQSGYYTSSRMIGNQLYVVSNDYIYSDLCKDVRDYAPCIAENDGAKTVMPLDCIACPESPSETAYLIISSIDTESGEKTADSKALFGAGTDIYCNENNMYVAMNKGVWWDYKGENSETETEIVKITLDKENISFVATGEVKGNTHNQFSMDERDGYLRIATTSQGSNGKDENNLFVLDENLNKVGEVTGFAKNEQIKAVRFIGDVAYVITYERTDPLFVIDVSQPTNPVIKGSVEISGFSSLLVPIDENTLLGIGYETEVDDNGITVDGIKLALFDISNTSAPTVLDSYVMKNAGSEVQYNHHALVVNQQQNYFAIPFDSYYYFYNGECEEYNQGSSGVLLFSVKDNKIVINEKFESDLKGYSSRCTYIGDTIYLLTDANNSLEITSFNTK